MIEDNPIKTISEDLFGRGRIVDSIVEMIKLRSKGKTNCYTIGLYGKWGEGKTSLLNIVYEKISEDEVIKIVRFNPWLFKDQESLLLDFFKALQNGNISKDYVEKIKQYGPLVSLGISGLLNLAMPGLGSVLQNSFNDIIKAVSKIDIDIRALKEEVNECIKTSKKHLLILIDDVDRLDKEEVHALFKLIRQNADFVNTTYIIAMDADMVAKSIGQRFGCGDEESGKHFLEKIIQVPIYLPAIQQVHLNKKLETCVFPLIELSESLENGDCTPSLEELKASLKQYVFPLFSTVREIILYTNSLAFILPFIRREVNLSDLCLLEALKLFHPEAYYLIRENKYLLTGKVSLIGELRSEPGEKRQEQKQQFIDKLLENVRSDKLIFIREIVYNILHSFRYSESISPLDIDSKKSLCSSTYFDKYFLYTTPDNVISERMFDDFIKNIRENDENELLEAIEFFYKQYGYSQLNRVIYQVCYQKRTQGIDNDSIGRICIALSRLSVNKQRTRYTMDDCGCSLEFLISDILENYITDYNDDPALEPIVRDRRKVVQLFETIVQEERVTLFHLFFATHFCERNSVYSYYKEEIDRSIYQLINRFAEQKGYNLLFGLSQTPTTVLFCIWKAVNMEEYEKIVEEYIFRTDFNIVPFVQKMIYNSEQRYYDKFCELFKEENVYNRLKNIDPNTIKDYHATIGYFIQKHRAKLSGV
ncbi:P-loop NTPase fold protein [Massilibacteroides sp.]|uniref:KAP family P-loop NTPase fold protein n=1 Tax=Massilibacteroides sp. TaxID=2034766 RepID=UPI002616D0F5|nr:P-loop NTPase fold protein [Massilibacteroides sp.]MDD4515968.1 P-loop NTPase fold protein [Massilibacteroides sp.]